MSKSKLIKEIKRFLVAGFTAVGTDLACYYLLLNFLTHSPAKAISFLCGTIVAYLINKFWTFEQYNKSYSEIVKFAILYSSTLAVNVLSNKVVLVSCPNFEQRTILAFLIATGISTILNFIGQKFWVFRKKKKTKVDEGNLSLFLLLGFVAVCFLILNFNHLNISFLSLHSVDEYAFFGSLITMYEGIINLNPQQFFAFGFYNYGVVYFFSNLVFTSPAIVLKNSELIIFLPRMVTAFSAIVSLFYIYKISRRSTSSKNALLFLIFLLTIPAFWVNAIWFHPDWMMTAALIICIYYFQNDAFQYKRNFWKAILAFSLALSIKFQTLTFYPLIFFYVFANQFGQQTLKNVKTQAFIFAKAIGITIFVFIFTNPYLIHPLGLQTFWNFLQDNIVSNATNHGSIYIPTLADKVLVMIDINYLPFILFLPFLTVLLWKSYQYFQEKTKSVYPFIALSCLINYIYYLFFVNKNWQHYYLAVFFLSILILIPIIQLFQKKKQLLFMLALILISFSFHFKDYQTALKKHFHIPETVLEKAQKESDILVESLKGNIKPSAQILISPSTSFEYEKLNLQFQNIHVIYGPLQNYMLDEKLCIKKYQVKTNKCNPKDFIVLRKNDIYFSPEDLKKNRDQTGYQQAIKIISELQNGSKGYKLLSENQYFYIWQKST